MRHLRDTGWEPRAVYDHLEWLMSPNLTFSTGALRGEKSEADQWPRGEGLHYIAGCDPLGCWLGAVMRGGGWGGSVRPS